MTKYRVGDKVRIVLREGNEYHYPFGFTDEMNEKFANKIVTIQRILEREAISCIKKLRYNGDTNGYRIKEDNGKFSWHSSMFEPVLEDSDSTIYTSSLQEGDLIPICDDMIGRIQSDEDSSEYYLDFDGILFDQEHSTCCYKLRKLVPDFEKIANEYNAIRSNEGCFPEFSTINDLVKFVQAVNNVYNSEKLITTPKTLNKNEIGFQKPKASVIGGFVPVGHSMCGKTSRSAIAVGHLSYGARSC